MPTLHFSILGKQNSGAGVNAAEPKLIDGSLLERPDNLLFLRITSATVVHIDVWNGTQMGSWHKPDASDTYRGLFEKADEGPILAIAFTTC